jgi:hypothetical protein
MAFAWFATPLPSIDRAGTFALPMGKDHNGPTFNGRQRDAPRNVELKTNYRRDAGPSTATAGDAGGRGNVSTTSKPRVALGLRVTMRYQAQLIGSTSAPPMAGHSGKYKTVRYIVIK